jgi:hypothetical protein
VKTRTRKKTIIYTCIMALVIAACNGGGPALENAAEEICGCDIG